METNIYLKIIPLLVNIFVLVINLEKKEDYIIVTN